MYQDLIPSIKNSNPNKGKKIFKNCGLPFFNMGINPLNAVK